MKTRDIQSYSNSKLRLDTEFQSNKNCYSSGMENLTPLELGSAGRVEENTVRMARYDSNIWSLEILGTMVQYCSLSTCSTIVAPLVVTYAMLQVSPCHVFRWCKCRCCSNQSDLGHYDSAIGREISTVGELALRVMANPTDSFAVSDGPMSAGHESLASVVVN